ncbi:MAG: hypothetical protein ACREL5_13515, partial [Gemmatimonadales bacterium]
GLYFEVSGVPVDSSYRVELTIKRVGRQSFFRKLLGIFGGGTSERLSFVRRQRGRRDGVLQEIDFRKLKPAEYVLQVAISAPDRERVIRRQEFTITR